MAAGGRRLRRPPLTGGPELTEGERWARDQLALLLGARFSPPAVARFLAASQRRANAERAARPATARRMRAWIACGAGAWAGLAAGGVAPFRRGARAFALWWAATWLMLDWHLGMVETEAGRSRNLRAADAMTLSRAWLVPLALEAPDAVVTLAAFATDVADGHFARRAEPTRIGRDLEGLVDSAFAVAALRGAIRQGRLPAAVGASEAVRLGVGFAYAVYVYFGRAGKPDLAVLRAARFTTPLRVGGLALAGAGRPRAGSALLGAGSAWSIGVVVRALARREFG